VATRLRGPDKLFHLKGSADILDRRGSVAFKLGMFEQSLHDFRRLPQTASQGIPRPLAARITCYYAGKFDEGKKQFEGYEQGGHQRRGRNAVWRYLCMAKSVGVEKARAQILKIGRDKRKPMMEVYALFAGKATPDDVIKSAKAGDPGQERLNAQLFYAHLYLGLVLGRAGQREKSAGAHWKRRWSIASGITCGTWRACIRDMLKKSKE